MQTIKHEFSDISATMSATIFRPYEDAACECHAFVWLSNPCLSFASQLENLQEGVSRCLKSLSEKCNCALHPCFKRYFLSDISNQAFMIKTDGECPLSVVGQPPLNGTKIAVWIYLKSEGNPYYKHIWRMGMTYPHADSEKATTQMLTLLDNELSTQGASLADNCMRTWLFVRDVDVNYKGVVVGRNKVFDKVGLTSATHFIASTGIGGMQDSQSVVVSMDAYSVIGLSKDQIKYLYARTHLSPTSLYGVAFERGTFIDYGDRRHIMISGTASIDVDGQVLYPDDIKKQTLRTIENVSALLSEAKSSWDDVAQAIVYLRDPSDYAVVSEMLAKELVNIPYVIVLAPVCRPAWLIEIECMAIKPIVSEFPAF